jgi:hypothetical protein
LLSGFFHEPWTRKAPGASVAATHCRSTIMVLNWPPEPPVANQPFRSAVGPPAVIEAKLVVVAQRTRALRAIESAGHEA